MSLLIDKKSRPSDGIFLPPVGLGLRREFLHELPHHEKTHTLDFLEVAPENWIGVGGKRRKLFEKCVEQLPLVCHGLSLSIGSLAPLNIEFLSALKQFLNEYQVPIYSEHLSYCSDEQGMLYDLLPMPFTEESVHYVATRILQVQDYLERTIALENISYYCQMPGELSELEFILAVLSEANCQLLLDVNNVYVNSVNHQQYQPEQFIKAIPSKRIAYLHIAGHKRKSADFIIDSHGTTIIDPVWQLLELTYQTHGMLPTLLERDNNIPALDVLFDEIQFMVQDTRCASL